MHPFSEDASVTSKFLEITFFSLFSCITFFGNAHALKKLSSRERERKKKS